MPDSVSTITQTDLENYAEVLLWALQESRGKPFENADYIVVRYDHLGLRLVEAVHARIMDAHLNMVLRPRPTPLMEGELFLNSSLGQLLFQVPGDKELYAQAAGVLTILAPESLTHLSHIDPRIMAEADKARRPLAQVMERRRRAGLLGWTTCLWPTNELAKAAGMDPGEYERQFLRACWLNMPDPKAEWRRLARETAEIAAWLDGLGAKSFHVESEDCDLYVDPGANRRFVGATGRNLPGLEIYLAPDCRATRGVFHADMPSLYQGHLVQGVNLEFQGGVVVRAEADQGINFLQGRLYADSGARRVGEFSLTDKRHSRVDRFMAHVLLDENFGGQWGNCHIALGSALLNSFSGPAEALTPELEAELGFNVSGLHWDMVNTGPRRVSAVLPDGKRTLVYDNGSFRR